MDGNSTASNVAWAGAGAGGSVLLRAEGVLRGHGRVSVRGGHASRFDPTAADTTTYGQLHTVALALLTGVFFSESEYVLLYVSSCYKQLKIRQNYVDFGDPYKDDLLVYI